MNFSIVDLENMNKHNKIFVVCRECNGKEKSVLYDGEEFDDP
jgi:translation initiation factor 2 beta subunit (eIF-2beta)/eIF-5